MMGQIRVVKFALDSGSNIELCQIMPLGGAIALCIQDYRKYKVDLTHSD